MSGKQYTTKELLSMSANTKAEAIEQGLRHFRSPCLTNPKHRPFRVFSSSNGGSRCVDCATAQATAYRASHTDDIRRNNRKYYFNRKDVKNTVVNELAKMDDSEQISLYVRERLLAGAKKEVEQLIWSSI